LRPSLLDFDGSLRPRSTPPAETPSEPDRTVKIQQIAGAASASAAHLRRRAPRVGYVQVSVEPFDDDTIIEHA
jgi:hypothetical protein